jgi:ATP-dependent exoDNAse (exonuclease V) beta subunit
MTSIEITQPIPQDHDVRKEVLDTHQSFAVSAPAGSGKTGLLTQRVLALLGQCEQPENILAITFTKKAAAEMKHRILTALQNTQLNIEQGNAPPADDYGKTTWDLAAKVLERNKEKNWQLFSLPNRLNITTIDSFCRQLSQQTPLTNELGATPDVLDNAEIHFAYQLAARETLACLELDENIKPDLIRLIKHFNNQLGTLEELFIRLLQRRDQWLSLIFKTGQQRKYLEATLQAVISDHLEKTTEAILPYSGEILELADFAANNCLQENIKSPVNACIGITELPETDYSNISTWLGLSELITTKSSGDIRKSVNKNIGFPAADKKNRSDEDNARNKQKKQRITDLLKELKDENKLINLMNDIRNLPSPNYESSQWDLLDSLTRVLLILVAKLDITFINLGKTDFINITLAALRALGDEDAPTNLALILDYRIQHILVDEFQDTSSPQLDLLKKLTAGWQPDDGRTLFLVGDAMQSCYSFRDANVGIFLNVRQHGLGDIALKPVNLSVNFRSQSAIVNWCNKVFSDVFPTQDEINQGAVKYQQAIAYNTSNEESSIDTMNNAIRGYLFVSEDKINHRTHEANKIVELIKHAQLENAKQKIAILVRKRSQVNEISRALSEHNIVYHATDINRLNTDMSIIDLRSLTRALLYPNDRLAWFSILRAPWCGLDMYDLYYIGQYNIQHKHATLLTTLTDLITTQLKILTKEYEGDTASISLSSEGLTILNRFVKIISQVMAKQGRCNLTEWVEGAWLQLGGGALLKDLNEHPKITTFFALLEKYQQGYSLAHWPTFDAAISNLYAKSSINKNSNIPPIEIMTIHKSKGLEFDTVIIPGLDLNSAKDKQELIVWQEWLDKDQQSRVLISPVHAVGNEKDNRDSVYDYIRNHKKQMQALESDRLFYVGCTRAIRHLYLLAQQTLPNNKTEDQIDLLTSVTSVIKSNTLLGKIWPDLKDSANIINIDNKDDKNLESALLKDSQNSLSSSGVIARLTPDWNNPEYPVSDLLEDYRLNHYAESLASDNRARPDALLQRYARYFGNVLHSALQEITETDYTQWSLQRINEQRLFWQLRLEKMGTPNTLALEKSHQICKIVEKILKSDRGQWILDNRHKHSACELSLWTESSNDEIKEYIIDRTFIDNKTNMRWIIDYKSSQPNTNQTLDNFISEQENLYKKQLMAYKKLFDALENPINCALYFPLVDAFHVIST